MRGWPSRGGGRHRQVEAVEALTGRDNAVMDRVHPRTVKADRLSSIPRRGPGPLFEPEPEAPFGSAFGSGGGPQAQARREPRVEESHRAEGRAGLYPPGRASPIGCPTLSAVHA